MSGQNKDEIIYDEQGNVVQTSTTPTPSTAAPSTPQTYEQWAGTGTNSTAYQQGVGLYNDIYKNATETAEANKQLGISYAEGIKNSTYQSAEAARNEANRLADVNYQRNVIDSQSSYQKAVGVYGSNAETLASNGLSGSGYGEWLQGNAYATHRGQVQAAGAQRLSTQKEAAYNEQQTKLAADQTYGQFLYQNDVEYNNAMAAAKDTYNQGMYQLGLGLSEAQNATYNDLYNKAASGQSIDSIKQDGRWGDLTAEQQKVIEDRATKFTSDTDAAQLLEQDTINDANFASWVSCIRNGSLTLKDAMAFAGYAELGDTQKTQLEAAEQERLEKEKKAEEEAAAEQNSATYWTVYNEASNGAALSALQSDPKIWNELTVDQQKIITDITVANSIIADLDAGNTSAKAVKESEAYTALGDDARSRVDRYIAKTEAKNTQDANAALSSYLQMAQNGMSIDSITAIARANGHYDTLVGSDIWKSVQEEATRASESIGNANYNSLLNSTLSGATIGQLQADGRWDTLSNDQKTEVLTAISKREAEEALANREKHADKILTYRDMALGGVDIQTIKDTMELYGMDWDSLGESEQRIITSAASAYEAAHSKIVTGERAEQLLGLAELASQGYDINDIKGWAKIFGMGDLTEDELAAIGTTIGLREAAEEKIARDERRSQIVGLAELAATGYGYSNSDIDGWAAMLGVENLTDAERAFITGQYDLYTSSQAQLAKGERTDKITALANLASQGYSLETIRAWATQYGIDELTNDELTLINSAISKYDALEEARTRGERTDKITALANLASQGYSLDTIRAWATQYGIDELTNDELTLINSAISKYDALEEARTRGERADTITALANLASQGLSLDTIKSWAAVYGIENLNETELGLISAAVDSYAEAQEAIKSENELDRAWGYAGLIEAGWSLDDVKALLGEDGYAALSDEAKRIIGATSDVMTRINKETAGKEAKDALLDYYDLAATGVDIATIEAIAKNYGHYAELKDNGWDLVTKTAETMSDKQTASLVIGMLDMPTAQDARDYLAYQGVSADKVDEIMAAWEERNTNDLLAGIKNGTVKKIDNYSGGGYAGLIVNGVEIRLRDLVNDIKQSIYGKGVSDILSAVADAYIAYAQSSSSVTRSQLALNMLNEFRLELSRNEIDASIIEEAYRQIERLPQYQNAISR